MADDDDGSEKIALDDDKMPILKAVDSKVLIAILGQASAANEKVSKINGGYRASLKGVAEKSNISLDALPTLNKVFRKAQKNSFDAKVLIVRIEEGLDVIRQWIEQQASLELGRDERREEHKKGAHSEANKKAAKENGEKLAAGLKPKKKVDAPPNPDKPDKQRAVGVIDQITGGATH